jgi:hypothetical protein
MGCCNSFTAVSSTSQPLASRHVNYVTGMVLGVDDYRQEFAYHSARDKWMVRDFLGYGTLSGLAVTVEDNGTEGPRVRVTPGSAAAPSGQMICVGREQCGQINAWLNSPKVKPVIDARASDAGTPAALNLALFLNLCYVDCATDDVPIPGEPCRSEENLMSPSRIADDYCLSFSLDRPLHREAQALAVIDAWLTDPARVDDTLGEGDPANFKPLVERAGRQIMLALGLAIKNPVPADLDPVQVTSVVAVSFNQLIRKMWITRIRPLVMAQTCADMAVGANDCVLLATLRMSLAVVGTHWEVTGDATTIINDDHDRPLMLSAMAMQSPMAAHFGVPTTTAKLAYFSSDGTVEAGTTDVVVAHGSEIAVTLRIAADGAPIPAAGETITLRHLSRVKLVLVNARLGNAGSKANLLKKGVYRLVFDGTDIWHVTKVSEEEDA